jgi:uncharacterized protein DUF4350
MPLGLEASDRKLLTICGTILVVLLFATALLSPQKETEQSATPSTYSSQSAGAEAAYLLLQRLHYPVTRWEQVPTELPDDPSGTLLILASPTNFPEKRERDAIETFVTNGGHVLITGTMVSAFFKGSDVSESFASSNAAWTSYAPYAPSRVNRDAPKITLAPKATWGALNQTGTALYGDPDAAVVVAWQHGKGEVLWWASATPLTNAGITRDDNLRFFLNSVGSWTKGEDYHIYWDEYFHGQRASLWSYASHTSILWGVVQISVIAFAVVFTFSRRSGPTYRPAAVSRLSPLEYVDTLGGLYQRAKASSAAIGVSYQRLRYLIARQLGLPSDAPDAELSHAAEERLGWKKFAAENLLGRASSATYSGNSKSAEALALVRELETFSGKLEIRPSASKEKN